MPARIDCVTLMATLTGTRSVLAVQHLPTSVAFFRDGLGFSIDFDVDGWCFLSRGGCRVMLGECPDAMPARQTGDHSYFAYIGVDAIDEFYEELRARGVQSDDEPKDTPWGLREFGVTSPDGHRMTFGQEIAPPRTRAITMPTSVADIVANAPARSIDDVVAMMTAIDQRLPDTDGVKWFNRLYLRVTEGVLREVQVSHYQDLPFMTALDVAFANLYFDAIIAAQRGAEHIPSAWRPLFECRHRPGIARLQFALAGMNAHINRDLPAGIVQAFESVGGEPTRHPIRRTDFDNVNDLLERVEGTVKVEFSVGLIGVIDNMAGRVDDVAAMWKVRAARAAAWTNAEVLWTLRSTLLLRRSFFESLDRFTGLASRGLLLPIADHVRT